ncbi:hypothetical protein AAH979_36620 [Plantactinospora sp. ZYX-F-223]
MTALATVGWPRSEALASADESGTVLLWGGGDTLLVGLDQGMLALAITD